MVMIYPIFIKQVFSMTTKCEIIGDKKWRKNFKISFFGGKHKVYDIQSSRKDRHFFGKLAILEMCQYFRCKNLARKNYQNSLEPDETLFLTELNQTKSTWCAWIKAWLLLRFTNNVKVTGVIFYMISLTFFISVRHIFCGEF